MLQPTVTEEQIDKTLVELASQHGSVWIPKHEMSDGTRCVSCAMVLGGNPKQRPAPAKCYLCT